MIRTTFSGSPRRHRAQIEPLESRRLLSASVSTIATFLGSTVLTGSAPTGPLVMASDGTLFGTTDGDGASEGTYDSRSLFKVAPGSGAVTPLCYFNGVSQEDPSNLVEDAAGNLFGETFGTEQNDGTPEYGTIFEYSPLTNTFTTIATFDGTDGSNPEGGLTIDAVGNLFGTTDSGGSDNAGTIFEIPSGSDAINTLYSFNAYTNENGTNPDYGVIEDSLGNLYGSTSEGGAGGDGTTFEFEPASETLHLIAPYQSLGPLTMDSTGDVFGMNAVDVEEVAAGAVGATTVAPISPDSDSPFGSSQLILNTSGDLFGETQTGGDYSHGTVFEIPAGSNAPTTLISFGNPTVSEGPADATDPVGGLIADSSGNLYGVTMGYWANGGASITSGGTIFEVSPSGSTVSPTASLTAVAPANQTATAGVSQLFSLGTFSQTNATAPYTITINWGDGSAASTVSMNNDGAIPSQSHTFATAGSDTVSISVQDSAGNNSNTAQFNVSVASAPVGTTGLALSVVKSTVPSSIVAGTKLKGAVTVAIDNETGASIVGTGTITLYATDASGGQTLVGELKRRLNIRNDRSNTLSIPVQAIALPAGTSTLLPQLAVGGDTAYVTTGPGVTVAPAYISLVATVGAAKPSSIAVNKSADVVITVANNGNIPATGSLVITLVPSADGVSAVPGVTLTTLTRRVTLKPGRSGKYTMRFKLPASLAAGSYYPLANISLDSTLATAAGSAQFTAG